MSSASLSPSRSTSPRGTKPVWPAKFVGLFGALPDPMCSELKPSVGSVPEVKVSESPLPEKVMVSPPVEKKFAGIMKSGVTAPGWAAKDAVAIRYSAFAVALLGFAQPALAAPSS